ncbi:MAG: BamA/TamA family outer membrane protein [bacterium]
MKQHKTILVAAVQILFFSALILSNTIHSAISLDGETKQDTLKKKRSGFTFFPIIFRSPDTKWAGGASVNYYYYASGNQEEGRPSTIAPTFIYTQRKQIISSVGADLYWKNDTYNPSGGITYIKFPDTFYGIGNNTSTDDAEDYTQRVIFFGLGFRKKIRSDLYIGVNYQFGHGKMLEVEANGLLARGDILGSRGGTVSGAGFSVNWDTRNNIFYPTSGGVYGFSVTLYNHAIGSDFDFVQYGLDASKYVPLFSSHVLAFQGVLTMRTGDPPFQLLSQLGGILRGYVASRFIDKNLFAMQVEYRLPVWWRFGLVGFAGFGDVANKITDFEPGDFKHSVGWGIRYLFVRDEHINLRIDFGFGQDSSQFYISFFEAF